MGERINPSDIPNNVSIARLRRMAEGKLVSHNRRIYPLDDEHTEIKSISPEDVGIFFKVAGSFDETIIDTVNQPDFLEAVDICLPPNSGFAEHYTRLLTDENLQRSSLIESMSTPQEYKERFSSDVKEAITEELNTRVVAPEGVSVVFSMFGIEISDRVKQAYAFAYIAFMVGIQTFKDAKIPRAIKRRNINGLRTAFALFEANWGLSPLLLTRDEMIDVRTFVEEAIRTYRIQEEINKDDNGE